MTGFSCWTERDLTWFYGDGSDGDVEITGSVTLAREMHYQNLTISAGAAVNPNGCRIFVRDTLDLSAAPSGAFVCAYSDGGDASGFTGGTPATTYYMGYNIGCMGGNRSAGQNGTTGAGVAGTNTYNPSVFGGRGGSSGLGGSGASGAGGAVGAPNTTTSNLSKLVFAGLHTGGAIKTRGSTYQWIPVVAGGGGSSAGSGAGDGSNKGGGGGAGGSTGTYAAFPTMTGSVALIWIGARRIERGSNANTAIFQAKGGAGGDGGNAAAGNCGGGGGAGGAGGGVVYLYCDFLLGSTIADAIDVSGGNGGNGGNGVGTGTAGDGGYGGGSGEVAVIECSKSAVTYTNYGSAVANSGQTGGTGTVLQVDL